MHQLPRAVIITQSVFWRTGNGLATRTLELVRFLAQHTELSVVSLHPVSMQDAEDINGMGLPLSLHVLADTVANPRQTLLERFRHRFNQHSPPAIYVVVQTELAFMAEAIPANGLRLLDTNDLVSDRTASFAAHNARDHFSLEVEEEIALFRRFHAVMCIQQGEYEKVCRWIGAERTLLVPHPAAANPVVLADPARHIGFAASAWHANVDGLKWFVERVWPRLADRDVTLDIYGPLSHEVRDWQVPGMRCLGLVGAMSECHANLDIFINPVRYGAGLKIKTVEAMAAGLPVVTTAQGASGLDAAQGIALLVAQDEDEFAAHVGRLLDDHAVRAALGRHAAEYARRNFSETRCFEPVLRLVRQLQESLSAEAAR